MPRMPLQVTTATKGKLITPTGFKNYDIGMNPYVGCQFGCTYCYVRFMVKDENAGWGDFVRLRTHLIDKLPGEIAKQPFGQRLVIGTMTDPYQPIERKERLTRQTLQIIKDSNRLAKVGIFTRSPFVLDDLDLIGQLPRPRVHFTITPYDTPILKKIEPVAIPIDKRLATIRAIRDAGIRVQANISPILPIYSEPLLEETMAILAAANVDEFYIDPMQPYAEAIRAIDSSMADEPSWAAVRAIVTDKAAYTAWKNQNREMCVKLWQAQKRPDIFAIWQDHQSKLTIDMNTNAVLNRNHYGEDAGVQNGND